MASASRNSRRVGIASPYYEWTLALPADGGWHSLRRKFRLSSTFSEVHPCWSGWTLQACPRLASGFQGSAHSESHRAVKPEADQPSLRCHHPREPIRICGPTCVRHPCNDNARCDLLARVDSLPDTAYRRWLRHFPDP